MPIYNIMQIMYSAADQDGYFILSAAYFPSVCGVHCRWK